MVTSSQAMQYLFPQNSTKCINMILDVPALYNHFYNKDGTTCSASFLMITLFHDKIHANPVGPNQTIVEVLYYIVFIWFLMRGEKFLSLIFYFLETGI